MNLPPLRDILDQVSRGALPAEEAEQRLLGYLRDLPFEDIGFARIDHHRALRKGFPEVIFGTGKTPAHIAAIAARIVARGHSLLVTRTTEEAYTAVAAEVPTATFHPEARAITLRQEDIAPGRGVILVAAAGTADLPVAEEAVVTAEIMGNQVERLYDVGVAGLHRLLAPTTG